MDVFDARAAPAIDRLIVVTDDEWHATLAGEQTQPGILDRVRVLELVDEQMLKTPLVVGEQFRVVPPKLVGAQ